MDITITDKTKIKEYNIGIIGDGMGMNIINRRVEILGNSGRNNR